MINWLEKNRFLAIGLTLIIATGIFWVSSIPGNRVEVTGGGIDLSITYHLIAFFLLNFFFLISANGNKKIKLKILLIIIFVSLLYAILDEIHQFFVPLRSPDVVDVLTDSIGIFLSTAVYIYIKNGK